MAEEECIPLPLDFEELLPPATRPFTAPNILSNTDTSTAADLILTQSTAVPTFHLYSRFWRDRNVFDVLANEVLWNICVDRVHDWRGSHFDGVLRAWSCGSSTGEEVYSLSMMWEYHYKRLHRHLAPLQLQILGTDRSTQAIEASVEKTYTCHSLHDLPQPLFENYTENVSGGSKEVSDTGDYFPPGTEPIGHYTRSGRKQKGGGFNGKDHKSTTASLTNDVAKRCRFLQQDCNIELPSQDGPFDLILARYSVLLYSDRGIEVVANIIQSGLLRPGGYLIVGASDNISPQVADWLHLVPVAPHVSKGMWQYIPKSWVPARVEKKTSNNISLPLLPQSNPPARYAAADRGNQNDIDNLILEDYATLSDFLTDGLHEDPPEEKQTYITEGSERILSRIDCSKRPPLHAHHASRLPTLLGDGGHYQDENDSERWDRTMRESSFGDSDFYQKERERVEARKKNRPTVLTEERVELVVSRMVEEAKKREERREERMKKMWRDEKKKFHKKKKSIKMKRRKQLQRVRRSKHPGRQRQSEPTGSDEEVDEDNEIERERRSSMPIPATVAAPPPLREEAAASSSSRELLLVKKKQRRRKKKRKKQRSGGNSRRPETAPAPSRSK